MRFSQYIVALSAALALTEASPLYRRSDNATTAPTCAEAPCNPFHLLASDAQGITYPLTADFSAPFTTTGVSLRLYAWPAHVYNISATTLFTYNAADHYLQTQHVTRTDPNGDAVPFRSGSLVQGTWFNLGPEAGVGDLLVGCVEIASDFAKGFYVVGPQVLQWALCDGDEVGRVLGRKVLYAGEDGDESCVAVDLVPVDADGRGV